MARVVALIATIPERRTLCGRLLDELAKQSRVPDSVLLVLDGYGDGIVEGEAPPAPACALPHRRYWTSRRSGPAARWTLVQDLLQANSLDPDDIIVCIDDDAVLLDAPEFIAGLVLAVEKGGGAAAAMGRDALGKLAPPGAHSRGVIMHAAGLGLTVRAKHLVGLREFAESIIAAGGPDTLTLLGDDDALVSAHLWKTGVPILHAVTGNVFEAPAARASAQSGKRRRAGESGDEQKLAIRRVTGWPFVSSFAKGV